MDQPIITTIFDQASSSPDPSAVIRGFLQGVPPLSRLSTTTNLLYRYIQFTQQQDTWIRLAREFMRKNNLLFAAALFFSSWSN
jgi:hypothetical protein